jgi:hypothetical protein
MFNQRKPPPPPPPPPTGGVIRLPTLNRLPEERDISSMLYQAQSARGKQVKLAWLLDRVSQQDLPPLLSCIWEPTAGEAKWTMQYGEGIMGKTVWIYESTDVGLILNFVLGTCTGTVQEGQMNDSSFARDPMLLSSDEPASKTSSSEPDQRTNAAMEGDLTDFSVPSLLQSISIAAMTGMLSVRGPDGSAEIYFLEGNPTHAQALGSFGDLALLDLFTWEQGKFHFFRGDRAAERTITRRLDSMIMEGVTLLDQAKFIKAAGIKPESFLIKKAHDITEADFEKLVSKGAPIAMPIQKRFFQYVDNNTTLFDILLRQQLPKTVWMPILYNLLSCGIISHSDRAASSRKTITLADSQEFDASIVSLSDPVKKQLIRSETGIYTYSAFVFFVEQECLRFEDTEEPFSVLVIAARANQGGKLLPLPLEVTKNVITQLFAIKRRMDILAHFQTLDLALLMPGCDANLTLLVAQRLYKLMMQGAFGLQSGQMHVTMGIASVPEHGGPTADVIGRARDAQVQASSSTPLLVAVSKDIQPPIPAEKEVPPPVPTEKAVQQPIPVEKQVPQPVPTEKAVQQPIPIEKEVPPPVPTEKAVQQPIPVAKEVPPPVPAEKAVQQPIPVAKEVPPPVPAEKAVQQPIPVEKEVPPPVPTEKAVQQSIPIEKEVPPPAPAPKEVQPPIPAEKEVQPPVPAKKELPTAKPTENDIQPSLNPADPPEQQ